MRTIHKYLPVLFSIIAMTFGSCSADYLDESDFPMEPGVGDTPLLNFDGQDNLTVSNDGGEYSFSFTANLPWMVESRASWVTIYIISYYTNIQNVICKYNSGIYNLVPY